MSEVTNTHITLHAWEFAACIVGMYLIGAGVATLILTAGGCEL